MDSRQCHTALLITFMLWSTADAERMPFEIGHCWYVDIDVIACFIGELAWFIDDQMDHLTMTTTKMMKRRNEGVAVEVNIASLVSDLLAMGVE